VFLYGQEVYRILKFAHVFVLFMGTVLFHMMGRNIEERLDKCD